jgi:hypothetical protein
MSESPLVPIKPAALSKNAEGIRIKGICNVPEGIMFDRAACPRLD